MIKGPTIPLKVGLPNEILRQKVSYCLWNKKIKSRTSTVNTKSLVKIIQKLLYS